MKVGALESDTLVGADRPTKSTTGNGVFGRKLEASLCQPQRQRSDGYSAVIEHSQELPEAAWMDRTAVGPKRRRAAPHVPVKFRWRIFVRRRLARTAA